MGKVNLFVKLEVSKSSGYIIVDDIILDSEIENAYYERLESSKSYGIAEKHEVLEGFKLMYLQLNNVEYDGRKRSINESDIKKSLEKQGYALFVCESLFGGYYNPTEKLTKQLEDQLNERKQLVNEGKFVQLKNVV